MKPLKREVKLILGISITVLLLAAIVIIVVFAIRDSKKGTQLLANDFEWVNKDGENYSMYDGYLIAGTKDGYVLTKDGEVISSAYSYLRAVDKEKHVFEFSTLKGEYGRLDSKGKEYDKITTNGNFVNMFKPYKDFDFTYSGGAGAMTVTLRGETSKSYKKVIPFHDTVLASSRLISDAADNSAKNHEAGIYVVEDDLLGEGRYLTSIFNQDVYILVEDILAFSKDYIAVKEGDKSVVYSLPSLEKFKETFDTVSSDAFMFVKGGDGKEIFGVSISENEFWLNETKLDFNSYPDKINAAFGKRAIVTTADGKSHLVGADGVIASSDTFKESGDSKVFVIGNKVFLYNLEDSGIESDKEITAIYSNDVTRYLVENDLYEYDEGGVFVKKLSGAATTFGDEEFVKAERTDEDGKSINEYYVYYISGNNLFDERLNSLTPEYADMEFYAHNLIRIGGEKFVSYGNKVVDGVKSVIKLIKTRNVYEIKIEEGEYFFVRDDGIYDFNGLIYSSDDYDYKNFIGDFVYGVMLESGHKIVIAEDGMYSGSWSVTGVTDVAFLGKNLVVAVKDNVIAVYEAEKKSIELKYSYFIPKVTFKEYRSDAGLVYCDGENCGFIAVTGKMALSAVYVNIKITEKNLLLVKQTVCALADYKGNVLTGFIYQVPEQVVNSNNDTHEIGGFLILYRHDSNTSELVNDRGNALLYGSILEAKIVRNYEFSNGCGGKYVESEDVKYFLIYHSGIYKFVRWIV